MEGLDCGAAEVKVLLPKKFTALTRQLFLHIHKPVFLKKLVRFITPNKFSAFFKKRISFFNKIRVDVLKAEQKSGN